MPTVYSAPPPSVLTPIVLAVRPEEAAPTSHLSAVAELYGGCLGSGRYGEAADVVLLLPGSDEHAARNATVVVDARAAQPAGGAGTVELEHDPVVPRPFRGLRLHDACGAAAPLEPGSGDRVLARGPRGPLWVVDRVTGRHRTAVLPDPEAPSLLAAFGPGRFLGLLPLLTALRSIALGGDGEPTAPLPASIVIDDPNLHRPRYGTLQFAEIARVAHEIPLHAAIATIPLDAWYADRRAVETFRGAPGALSLLVHGNNHVSRELARPLSDADAVAQLTQALARISRFERRTGLRVSRTMAAPHGACSRPTIRRLARLGFRSLTISRPRPWTDDEVGAMSDSVEPLSGARPVELVDGLPLVLRTHVDHLDRLPFAAFLRQPLVVYGHHWDWPAGATDLARTAEEVERMGDVRWVSMDGVLREGGRVARNGSVADVTLDARVGWIELPEGVSHACIDGSRLDTRDAVVVNGARVQPGVPFAAAAGSVLTFELVALDAPVPGSGRRARTLPWPVVRRLLTESRDRMPRRTAGRRDR